MQTKDTYYTIKTYTHLTHSINKGEITFDRAVEIINSTSILTIYEKMDVLVAMREQFGIGINN